MAYFYTGEVFTEDYSGVQNMVYTTISSKSIAMPSLLIFNSHVCYTLTTGVLGIL